MNRTSIPSTLLAAALCAATIPAAAAAAERTLGVLLWHESPNDLAALEGLRAAAAEGSGGPRLLVRHAKEDREEAVRILRDFRSEKVDLVVALGTQGTVIAREEVKDLPVVFAAVTNPVESGIVASWSGSGTNLAGISNWIPPETVLRVFRSAVPGLERLGILRSESSGVVSAAELREMRRHVAETAGAAAAPRLEIVEETVRDAAALPSAVDRLARARVQAIWIPIDFLVYENLPAVLAAAQPHRLPLVSSSLKGAQAGAVAGIHVDYAMLGRKTWGLARRILETGAAPGGLPVETMSDHLVVANLAAAERCGYQLPLTFIVQADIVLEDARTPRGE